MKMDVMTMTSRTCIGHSWHAGNVTFSAMTIRKWTEVAMLIYSTPRRKGHCTGGKI